MRWRGETVHQREDRHRKGIRCYALLPVKMDDGMWVWLEHYWSALWCGPNNRRHWVNALEREDCVKPRMKTPPPLGR